MKGAAGGSGREQGVSLSSVSFIPAQNKEPKRQEGREGIFFPSFHSFLNESPPLWHPALYLLESNSLSSTMLTRKPANVASSSVPESQLIIHTVGVCACAKACFHLEGEE